MMGPPGSGKSMLAQRLSSILPPLLPRELLDASMIASRWRSPMARVFHCCSRPASRCVSPPAPITVC
ncbi:MAG: ATP-binding protein [Phyllobacterium sp.]|uniref:ATP-binding protein n=1 Tax=Phyllobacterium sp. TaxID=1871046 RepID=UPI0030F2627B